MRSYILILCLALLTPLLTAADNGDDKRRSALYNPHVSARDIALNKTVQVDFTTPRPQVDGVDVAESVRNALELPSVEKHWRLMDEPEIEHDERIRTVHVRFHLRPRHPGELKLPEITVTWLPENRVAHFGTVTVQDHLDIGSEQRPLPVEMERIAGYDWDASVEDIKETLEPDQIEEHHNGSENLALHPKQGLTLFVRNNQLHSAELFVPRISLEQARSGFNNRWGPPTRIESDQLQWFIGWLRIEATEATRDDIKGVAITIVHENVDAQVLGEHLDEHVFDLLEDTSTHVPAASKNGSAQNAETDSRSLIERTFEDAADQEGDEN